MTDVSFTTQFKDLFARAKGKPGTVVMQINLHNGSKVCQELTSKKLPENLDDLKEKAIKISPKHGVTSIRFVNIYQEE